MTRAREIAFALALTTISIPAFAVDRPPQFVAIAFDNCTELFRWKELSEFSARMNAKGETIHFTFFVSGVNFLASGKRALYQGPHQPRGHSMIPFSSGAEEVAERVKYINEMRDTGHEIASHAVGHFDGKHWSSADWAQEFKSYGELLDHVAGNNDLSASAGFAFPASSIVGFRAPYLSTSAGLYPALKAAGFRYDTSETMLPNLWPEKKGGLWRFNLAEIRLHRSRKMTLSMDYNFLVVQSLGLDQSARRKQDRDEMLETYLDYFKANYFGNRAPLQIGHHLRLSRRRLPRGASYFHRARLRPAGGEVRDLFEARRFHGRPERGDARSLSERRFPSRHAAFDPARYASGKRAVTGPGFTASSLPGRRARRAEREPWRGRDPVIHDDYPRLPNFIMDHDNSGLPELFIYSPSRQQPTWVSRSVIHSLHSRDAAAR